MATLPETSRAAALGLLKGQRRARVPAFSVLSTIIAPALEARGLVFHEIHHDADKLVTAAASAYELYGIQSATLPADLTVEAEAFGATVDFRADMPEPMWAIVPEPYLATPADVKLPAGDFAARGRIPLVVEAIRKLKARVGSEIAVGAWIAGPFTMGMYTVDFDTLLLDVKRTPRDVAYALDQFTDALSQVAKSYHNAGADFITIHEMGGTPGVLGPRRFEELLLPRLQHLVASIPAPTILSVCGNTNGSMHLLAQAGASALHVDQVNDLAQSRATLGHDVLLFGNLDPVGVIANGTPETIRAAVRAAAQAGVDAVMPGCDLYFQTPEEHLRAFVDAAEKQKA